MVDCDAEVDPILRLGVEVEGQSPPLRGPPEELLQLHARAAAEREVLPSPLPFFFFFSFPTISMARCAVSSSESYSSSLSPESPPPTSTAFNALSPVFSVFPRFLLSGRTDARFAWDGASKSLCTKFLCFTWNLMTVH